MLRRIFSGILVSLLLIGILSLAFRIQPVKAQPTTIIVPDDYPTIQAAINAASVGDTVYVRDGTYQEDLDISKSITLMGESNQNTMIEVYPTSSGGRGISITADNVILENFNILGMGALGGGVIWVGSVNGSSVGFSNVIIRDNKIACATNGSSDTLDLWGGNDNIIEHNQIIVRNNSSSGIAVVGGFNNTVDANSVTGGWVCIALMIDDSNTVSDNYVTGQTLTGGFSDVGAIDLTWTSLDVVVGNTMINNALGLSVDKGSNCVAYHNNFINNTQQVLTENGSQVLFDNGYPSGGNYWSGYVGIDLKSGPIQDQLGSDGIGDTPYIIDANNTDHYPLMSLWNSNASITFGQLGVGSDFTGTVITIDGINYNVSELPLTFQWNVGSSHSFSFASPLNVNASRGYCWWSTSGLSNLQNDTLTVMASGNVTATYGLIGDLNHDGTVSLLDLSMFAYAWHSCSGDSNWNPECDIASCGVIGLIDLVTFAMHYGQHYH
jgi:parallel beta-helix repeat protein